MKYQTIHVCSLDHNLLPSGVHKQQVRNEANKNSPYFKKTVKKYWKQWFIIVERINLYIFFQETLGWKNGILALLGLWAPH